MYSQEEIAGIYQRQYKMVYQICFMLMKNTPDAEDAAQTVFRKVIERDTPFRDPEHEKAWLIVTARNECRGQLKHWWRTRREGAAALDTLTWNQPESGLVWEQVAALAEKHRLVLYLHYYEGFSTREVGEMLRISQSAVTTRLLRARKKLKEVLGEDCPYEA